MRSFQRIRSHLLKKSLKENFIFCAVTQSSMPLETSCEYSYQHKIVKYFHKFSKIDVWQGFEYVSEYIQSIFEKN